VPPRKRQHTTPTGRGSTYQGRKPVQTKPATAMDHHLASEETGNNQKPF